MKERIAEMENLYKWRFTTIDLESAQGYCHTYLSVWMEVVENGMITQEVHLVAQVYSQI
jgi:hypothetical protein